MRLKIARILNIELSILKGTNFIELFLKREICMINPNVHYTFFKA